MLWVSFALIDEREKREFQFRSICHSRNGFDSLFEYSKWKWRVRRFGIAWTEILSNSTNVADGSASRNMEIIRIGGLCTSTSSLKTRFGFHWDFLLLR